MDEPIIILRSYAMVIGVQNASQYKNKGDLIRAIQVAEGNIACFEKDSNCKDRSCRWYEDCE
jgi:hypothetical protein